LENKIHHAGDCSIYQEDVDICDCGQLRKLIRLHPELVEQEWIKHQVAINRSIIYGEE